MTIKEKKTIDYKIYIAIKRIIDIIVSIVGIAVCFIPALLIALLIKIESPGPAIFIHNRIGQYGKPLPLIKFRSMHQNAEYMIKSFTPEQRAQWEENFKLDEDPRITKVGDFLRRTSLDEIPQLINILKGELSLVGPRPIVEEELDKYGENKEKFLSAKPGLTGYWQAYARSNCSYEQRMEMELHYVDNANLLWDIKIIFATIGTVITKSGAK